MKTTKEQLKFTRSYAEIHGHTCGVKILLDILDDLDTALARVKLLEDEMENISNPDPRSIDSDAFIWLTNWRNNAKRFAKEALARSRALGESKDEVVE